MELIAERIKLARVEAIEIMFKELDIDEKTRCLDDLKKIMYNGFKRSSLRYRVFQNLLRH